MIGFSALAMPMKTLLTTALFLTLCLCICLTLIVGRKQGNRRFVLLLLSTLSIGFAMLLYASIIPAERAKPRIPVISVWFSQLPLPFSLLLLLLVLFFCARVIRTQLDRQKTAITLFSIKESLDHLQTGLCFSRMNGLILLTNHRMNNLSHALFGAPLQNARLFWEALCSRTPCAGVKRLRGGERPEFLLEDGTVWSFRMEKLDSVMQITAADVTREHNLLSALRTQNAQLEELNTRIRSYGEKVDEYIIARERLETRVNLHGFLGQSLLMTRCHLADKSGDAQQILDVWRRNIDVLRLEAEPEEKTDSFTSLVTSAKAIGMQVHVTGSLPAGAQLRKLLASIGAETLTNAVRHAGAKQLYIDAQQTPSQHIIRYTNDGSVPSRPIAEGGGLSTARRKVEAAGGSMKIESAPRFTLTLTFPKEVTSHV